MGKQKNSQWKQTLIYVLILALSVMLIYWFVSGNQQDKRIKYSDFVKRHTLYDSMYIQNR